jgi:hypothetical protein
VTTTKATLSRWLLGLMTAALAIANTQAQTLRVTAANASNSSVYDVNFVDSAGFITQLNTDQNAHVSLRSLAYIPNAATGKIDLLVADTSRGEIIRYAAATGTASVVWSTAQGPGPIHPDGLSDGDGNLFVVSSAPGSPKPAQLWVLPRDPAFPAGANFLAPRLIDNTFGGLAVQALEESTRAHATSDAANAGDLLVLSGSPPTVLVYSALGVQSVINGGGPISPSRILISAAQFPAGVSPGGMDFWPPDNTLLVTTASGTVLRYSFTPFTATRGRDFTTDLGNGKFKVKTGLEGGVPFAFVANNNGGQILKFGAPPAQGGNPPLAIVTSGVQRPQGLVTTNLAATPASDCLQTDGGCDILGDVLKHNVNRVATLSGFVIEDVCVVAVDPRITQYGTCTGHSLPVAQVCAGYGATVIPDYLCGSSGNSGFGFALVKSLTNTLDNTKGALIAHEAFADTVLPGANPPCPQTVLGWAPSEGEGTIVEGNTMLEITASCGSSAGNSRGLSVFGLGIGLNSGALPGKNATDKLVKFAASKYDGLNSTINLASITSAFRTSLVACIATSRDSFDKKKYANAAAQLVVCDSLVAANEASFSASLNNPNPSGEIRGRLGNLYLTINTRILGNSPGSSWPL